MWKFVIEISRLDFLNSGREMQLRYSTIAKVGTANRKFHNGKFRIFSCAKVYVMQIK